MKALTSTLTAFPQSFGSRSEHRARGQLRSRLSIILALATCVPIFILLSYGNPLDNQEGMAGVLNADDVTSPHHGNTSSSVGSHGFQGADIPFRDRDGVTLYMPYGGDDPLRQDEGLFRPSDPTSAAFHSNQDIHDPQVGSGDGDNTGGQYPSPSGYDGNGGPWWPFQFPGWGGNLGNSGNGGVGGTSGAGPGNNGPSGESGKGPGTGPGNNSGPSFNDVGIPPIVSQDNSPEPVPEPGSLLLFASGLISIVLVSRKKTAHPRR